MDEWNGVEVDGTKYWGSYTQRERFNWHRPDLPQS